jgi:peptidoglycan/xylan/chitin deacetylase (PgdA/CDA1 family)
VALTFDDGPDPRYTPQISRLLAERGHEATFFVLGAQATRHPEVLRQLVADGHELASHGFDHGQLAFSPPSRLRTQLLATEEAIRAGTGAEPVALFRAPHGVRSPWLGHVARGLGYRVCGWNGRIFDTAKPGVEAIIERAARHLRPGATLLLHDGDGSASEADRSETLGALPGILDEAERRGLRSVRLSSLIDLAPDGGASEATRLPDWPDEDQRGGRETAEEH